MALAFQSDLIENQAEKKIVLREYQEKCLRAIADAGDGRYIIQMATGLGKTVVFAALINSFPGRVLILSHRDELVRQPIKYISDLVGIEQAGEKSHGERVVSASVPSMARRLKSFDPGAFDLIIVDEAHHSSAISYRNILSHFNPLVLLGFTATPNRADGAKLDDLYDRILFERNIRWGIENEYLSPIYCRRVNIGFDLSSVKSHLGDYKVSELEQIVNVQGANSAVGEAWATMAAEPGLLFAVSVNHAHALAKVIPGAAALDGTSKNRSEVVADFIAGNISCLINCQLFTEGTDLPNVETVMIARPTKSNTLYTQMVGRGVRLYPGKKRLELIDCVGRADYDLCTAPCLVGMDTSAVPQSHLEELFGDLFAELPAKIEVRSDLPECWIRNVEIVNIWANKNGLKLHDVNWYKHASGYMTVKLPRGRWLRIDAPDLRGETTLMAYSGWKTARIPIQEALDKGAEILRKSAQEETPLWSRSAWRSWGRLPATQAQKNFIRQFMSHDPDRLGMNGVLTKGEASLIINRIKSV